MSESRLQPRKVPRQLRAEATVAAVIEAAALILEREGLEGYNTNAVARSAGISVGSLYQYFPHKDAITRALIDREASSLITQLEDIAEESRGLDGVRKIVAATVTHLMRRPNLSRILDIQEQRLSLQDAVLKSETCVRRLIQICLSNEPSLGLLELSTVITDMMSIVRGMVDGAAAQGESDIPHLIDRVDRAVSGYISSSAESAAC